MWRGWATTPGCCTNRSNAPPARSATALQAGLEAFVRNVLRDGRNELLGGEDLEITLGLGVHPRAVDDGAVFGVVDHLLLGERVADDVLRDTFKPGGIAAPQRLAVVHAEPPVLSLSKGLS